MAFDRNLLEEEKARVLDRLFASKSWGIVTGTQDGRNVERLGIIERRLKKLRSDDE